MLDEGVWPGVATHDVPNPCWQFATAVSAEISVATGLCAKPGLLATSPSQEWTWETTNCSALRSGECEEVWRRRIYYGQPSPDRYGDRIPMDPRPLEKAAPFLLYAGGLLVFSAVLAWMFMRNPTQDDRQIEAKRLHFAAAAASGLSMVFLMGMGMYYWSTDDGAGDKIFDACKTIVPPFGTLILGYYFGQSQRPNKKSSVENPTRGTP